MRARVGLALVGLVLGLWGLGGAQAFEGAPVDTSPPVEGSQSPYIHDKGSPAVGFFPGRRLASSAEKREIVATAMYGSINDYAYYFIDISIGSPPQRQSVILDTGSSLMGFPCQPCDDCGEHLDAYFDVTASTTADRFTCQDARCVINSGSCPAQSTQDTCFYRQPYLEGSVIDGYFVSDLVRLGQNPDAETRRYDHVGCHLHVTKMFREQKANGILGVSFPRLAAGKAQPTIVDVALGSPTINAKVFAICLAEDGGVFSVGGYAREVHKDSLSYQEDPTAAGQRATTYPRFFGLFKKLLAVPNDAYVRGASRTPGAPHIANLAPAEVLWVPLASKTAYLVRIRSVRAGSRTEYLANSEALMDSGTTYSYFPSAAYALIESFLTQLCLDFNEREATQSNNRCATKQMVLREPRHQDEDPDIVCFSWPNADDAAVQTQLERMPSLWLALGDNTNIEWKAESWLFRKAPGKYCAAMESNGSNKQVILGLSFMKHKQVVFDRENDLIGIVSANCPSYLEQSRVASGKENTQVINYATASSQEARLPTQTEDVLQAAGSVEPAYLAGDPWTGRLDGFDRPSLTPWAMAGGLTLSVVAALACMARRSLRRGEEGADSPQYVPYAEELGLAELGGARGSPDDDSLDLEGRPN